LEYYSSAIKKNEIMLFARKWIKSWKSAGHGGEGLLFQHLEDRHRRIMSSRTAWLNTKFVASLGYIGRPCLRKKKKTDYPF
jgi:hypothetical protein